MKQYKVAILGATGAVGREMMKILAERSFPISELHLLASARSAGKILEWRGKPIEIEEACDEAFAGMDIVLGAAENDIAKRFAPAIVRAGAVFVDNSSAFRMDPNVPLIVPEINPEDAKLHHGIISNPNCSTIITVTAVNALNALSPIRTMTASTYQAVSGAGAGGPIELAEEVEALRTGKPVEPKVFAHQIAYNLIPQIGSEREILKEYYDRKKQSGFDYAYRYPGMNKVLQAAGRVIRTKEDRGVILLLDDRFLGRDYGEIFPREWKDRSSCRLNTVEEAVSRFWRSFT